MRIRIGSIATIIFLTFTSIALLFPIFWTISTSLKTRAETFQLPPVYLGFTPTLRNYEALFSDAAFLRVLINTIVVTVGSTLLAITVGALAAYGLARARSFPGRRPLEVSLILLRAMPGVVLVVPLYDLLANAGLLGKMPTLIVLYALVNLPFTIWIMTPYFQGIPAELEEAAVVDGASSRTVFLKIVLPVALPGIAATALFVGLLAWNEFLIPVVLGNESTKTLPVLISGFISARDLDWGPMAAASSLAIIPIAIVTIVMQRRLVSGLSQGAVKG
jgi:ABC-type glycerol-3-phosphate transport system permease component